ncbi:hypothetical protein NPIL_155471 [Nephila pilipes]|uniref:Uncharacterized protein n=1 Tax=Nephila pilipes TaxID=299642 RepID=A0A8X6JDX7_NEPPI|nr:hypothetical protein NPIL_155471 [Nephila pilipes]
MSWSCFRRSRRPPPTLLEHEVHYRVGEMMKYILIAFVGNKGSGRNTLAWRFRNMDHEGPPNRHLNALFKRHVIIDLASRPAVGSRGYVKMDIRIVPPEFNPEELPFFSKHGEISDCAALVFCVDIADSKSSEDLYMWMKKARRSLRRMPPILIVGTKVDERSFRVTTPLHLASRGGQYLFGERVLGMFCQEQ